MTASRKFHHREIQFATIYSFGARYSKKPFKSAYAKVT